MPLAQQSSLINPLSDYQESARVLDLQKWKEKMVKESNGDHKDKKSNKDMSQDEILYEIMNIFTESDMDLETRLEMLESIQKLAAKKRAKKKGEVTDKDPDQD
jgi:signal recognition particle GTPase